RPSRPASLANSRPQRRRSRARRAARATRPQADMATKRALILSALGEIGLADYLFDASPEDLQDALDRLNRMAAQWDGQGIRVGFNLGGGLDDESGVPDSCEEAFYTNL